VLDDATGQLVGRVLAALEEVLRQGRLGDVLGGDLEVLAGDEDLFGL